MMIGHRLGNRDARGGYDEHRTNGDELTGGKHGKTSWGS
jgi:hypothetical protein